MSTPKNSLTRRQALKGAIVGGAVLASGRLIASDAQMPKVSEDDAQAKALGYRHDNTQVDTSAYPKKANNPDQRCSNCALYVDAQGPDGWGGCGIFPGKLVNAEGWCNVWAPKA